MRTDESDRPPKSSGIGTDSFRFALLDGGVLFVGEVRILHRGHDRCATDGQRIDIGAMMRAIEGWDPDAVYIAEAGTALRELDRAVRDGLTGCPVVSVERSDAGPRVERDLPLVDAVLEGLRRHPAAFGRAVLLAGGNRAITTSGHDRATAHDPLGRLSEREIEVLTLIGDGYTRTEIARTLSRSPKTIDGHQARIMTKLGLDTRARLIRFAIASGLVDAPLPVVPFMRGGGSAVHSTRH